MESLYTILSFLSTFLLFFSIANAINSNLFREYIGAEFTGVKFSDIPINPDVQFHFILSFAIDYTDTKHPSPTNGKFDIFWDAENLSPADVSSIKSRYRNVRLAVSLGGNSVNGRNADFAPESVSSWVSNAVASLTSIIKRYDLDGIDIDYEHFSDSADPGRFAECMGLLITTLKKDKVISFASIAPFDDASVQSHYLALWRGYHRAIDYVNFQFYAYDKGTRVPQFLQYFERQSSNYKGGQVLASFISDGSGGLGPDDGFFEACEELKRRGKLGGIFVWSADDSRALGYGHEERSQLLLASQSH